MRKPAAVVEPNSQHSTASGNAMMNPTFTRVPSSSAPTARCRPVAAIAEVLPCRVAPGAVHQVRQQQLPMYTSMRLTKISLVRNRVRSNAGIAAHAMPPSTPAASTAAAPNGQRGAEYQSHPAAGDRASVSCPSAPIFQTLARKLSASPSAHSISGVAFSSSSPTP